MNIREIKKALRNGKYSWPGGYPLYFITTDGEPLSFEAVRAEWRQVVASCFAYRDGSSDWHIVDIDMNLEDPSLFCAHTGQRIESAYSEDQVDTSVFAFSNSSNGRVMVYGAVIGFPSPSDCVWLIPGTWQMWS
jgi:hypothetical protein